MTVVTSEASEDEADAVVDLFGIPIEMRRFDAAFYGERREDGDWGLAALGPPDWSVGMRVGEDEVVDHALAWWDRLSQQRGRGTVWIDLDLGPSAPVDPRRLRRMLRYHPGARSRDDAIGATLGAIAADLSVHARGEPGVVMAATNERPERHWAFDVDQIGEQGVMERMWDLVARLDREAREEGRSPGAEAPVCRVGRVSPVAAGSVELSFEPLVRLLRNALEDPEVVLPEPLAGDVEAHLQMAAGWERTSGGNPVMLEVLTGELTGLYLQVRAVMTPGPPAGPAAEVEAAALGALEAAQGLGAADEAEAVETAAEVVLPAVYEVAEAASAELVEHGDTGSGPGLGGRWDAALDSARPWAERIDATAGMLDEVLESLGKPAKRLMWVAGVPTAVVALRWVLQVVLAVFA